MGIDGSGGNEGLGNNLRSYVGLCHHRSSNLDLLLGLKIYTINLSYLVNDLSLHCLVFNSLLVAINWDVFGEFLLVDLGNVFSLVFYGIIVGDFTLTGYILDILLFLVF